MKAFLTSPRVCEVLKIGVRRATGQEEDLNERLE
jgi:hypothetical protein